MSEVSKQRRQQQQAAAPGALTFISSLVYPFSWNTSMCGMMLNGSWWAKNSLLCFSPLSTSVTPRSSSAMPSAPAPDAAWYLRGARCVR